MMQQFYFCIGKDVENFDIFLNTQLVSSIFFFFFAIINGLYTPWGCKESDTAEQLSHHIKKQNFQSLAHTKNI